MRAAQIFVIDEKVRSRSPGKARDRLMQSDVHDDHGPFEE